MVNIEITAYSWGTLRVVSRDNHYKAIIHPEHFELISSLSCGEKASFTDEQGLTWNVALTDTGYIVLKAANGRSLYFSLQDLTGPIQPRTTIDTIK